MSRSLPPSELTHDKWDDLKKFTFKIYSNWQHTTPEGSKHSWTHPSPFARYVERHKPKLCQALARYSKRPLVEAIRFIIRGKTPVECEVCGNLMLRKRKEGTCSMKCRGRSSSVKEKAMNTSYVRYGVSNFAKTKECLKRQRETWAKRGGHWAAQAAQTNRQSYGEKVRLSHERTGAIERAMATKKERYGENWGKHLAKRATRTMKERYGDHWFATERGKEEARKGMIRNHGVSSPLASQKIMAKRNATVIARYGREPSGLPEFRKAIESTLVHRYGKDHQKKRIRNIARTNLRRRGIEHPLVVSDHGLKVIQIKGKRFECYGYEPQAIYYLIGKKQIHPCSIRTSRDMLGEGALLLGERKVYPDL